MDAETDSSGPIAAIDIRFAAVAGAQGIRGEDTDGPGLRLRSQMMAQMPPAERGGARRSTVMEAPRAGLHRAPDQFTDQIGIPAPVAPR